MKNKINFGVSTTRIGALQIHNFRIRTNSPRLQSSIQEYITRLNKYSVDHHTTVLDKGFVMYDFTSTKRDRFDQMLENLAKIRLTEKVNKLNDKFGEVNVKLAMWEASRIQRKLERDADMYVAQIAEI